MISVRDEVKSIIEEYDLLKHPFYQAWSDGTLETDKLRTYSAEYGTFIRQIAPLWDSCGNEKIANIEREHAEIWEGFAESLERSVRETPVVAEVAALNSFIDKSCESKSRALGALLAFEYQQPSTVESKLKGLRTHYSNLTVDEKYFEIHLDDWDEPEMLIEEIEGLGDAERQVALASLKQSCQHLWDALTGIHNCN